MDVFGKRHKLLGGFLSVAPDWYIWLWAYILTTGSAAAVVYLSHDLWTRSYRAIAYGLIVCNQVSSYVLLLSDPGIYPRGEEQKNELPSPTTPTCVKMPECDVVSTQQQLQQQQQQQQPSAASKADQRPYCHTCRLYRPPRCSHCYVCGVCILEHDHHCVLLGVCVGKRSLRWFVLYLLSTTLQLYAGMFFLVLSFRRTPFEEDWKKLPPPPGSRTWTPQAIEAFSNHATWTILSHLVVMGIIALLMIPITAGTVAYVLLPLTNTTWREAQHGGIRLRKPEHGRRHFWLAQLCVNINKMLCAGPSLLSSRNKRH